ncbi:MAG: hypothetical protein JSW34_06550 [Candidatus Zixiibacteriota bacterium]|nr:MAG: hypothetical protein JSW34_06550 [candidate division Zixibacteria bacterium]
MSIEHLSEEQIQQYLDDKTQPADSRITRHLESCRRCRYLLKEYQQLYGILGRESEELLSPTFTASTMEKVEALGRPAEGLSRPFVLWVAAGVVACVAAIWYTVDVKALLDGLGSFLLGWNVLDSTAVSSLRTLSARLGDSLPLVIFAGLILLAVALADKLLLKQRVRRVYFLSV